MSDPQDSGGERERMSADPLWTFETRPQRDVLADLLRICFPGLGRVLDPTYGHGGFYGDDSSVMGGDRDETRAKDFVADFRHLPFMDRSVDVTVFDPPFQPQTVPGLIGARFTKSRPGVAALRKLVVEGAHEAWRVSRRGIVVKVQDYIHDHKPVWMSLWLHEALGEPYEFTNVIRKGKLKASNWGRQMSAYRNHSTWWVWSREKNR